MFGYIEYDYVVLKKHEVKNTNDNQVFEVRFSEMKTIKGAIPETYIAVMAFNDEGSMTLDILLQYPNTEEGASNLSDDWGRLINEPDLTVEDLKCFNWIENHQIGRSKYWGPVMH